MAPRTNRHKQMRAALADEQIPVIVAAPTNAAAEIMDSVLEGNLSLMWPKRGPPAAQPTSKIVEMYPDMSWAKPRVWFRYKGSQKYIPYLELFDTTHIITSRWD